MQETETRPWDLPTVKIADAVTAYRILMDMSKADFYNACGIHHLTLDKVEAGEQVDKRIIGRIDRRFPGVFA